MADELRSTQRGGPATRLGALPWSLALASVVLAACAADVGPETDGEVATTTQALSIAPDTGCAFGTYGGHDYWFCPVLRSWQTARTKCQAIGFDLASVNSSGENQFLFSKQFGNGWIGGTDVTVEGAWRWTTPNTQFWSGAASGSAVGGAYTQWVTGQPNNTIDQDCLVFQGAPGPGKWSDESCALAANFICEGDLCPIDPGKTDPGQCGCGIPDTDADGDGTADCNDACPSNPYSVAAPCAPDSDCVLKTLGGKNYFFCRNYRNYATAKQKCAAVGFKLARIDSAAENDFIDDAVLTDRWVGGNDIGVEGKWVWEIAGEQFWQGAAAGTPVNGAYRNWKLAEPNDLLGQDCLQVGLTGQWWDDKCTDVEQFVCEEVDVCGGCAASTTACMASFCDEHSRTCKLASNEGGTCNDGNPATTNEICAMGRCTATPTTTPPVEQCDNTTRKYINQLRSSPTYASKRRKIAQDIVGYQALIVGDRFNSERTDPIQIPVVVHVVGDQATQDEVTDQQIADQIAQLNLDYRGMGGTPPFEFASVAADMLVEFVLAKRNPSCQATTGITRRTDPNGTEWCFSKGGCGTGNFDADAIKHSAASPPQALGQTATQRGMDAWDTDRYLNIWVGRSANGTVGRATLPGDDTPDVQGVIVDELAFGRHPMPSAFTMGRSLTHEIGHYFNLYHIYNDSCVGMEPAGSAIDACDVAGDRVCDTPPQVGLTNSCAVPGFKNTCAESPNRFDMISNYMDYTWDSCMSMFTAGQKTILDATLNLHRPGLKNSSGLIPPPAGNFDLWSADDPYDVGNQPNAETNKLWKSQDIWVRHRHDEGNNQEHQNPLYLAPGETTPDMMDHNHVYLNVRNRGCMSSSRTYANMFWAKASSSLSWPGPWDGVEKVPGTSIAMGGRVTGDDNKNWAEVPALTAGERTVVRFDWTVPNPADYAPLGGNRSHFCLLAVIDPCAADNFNASDHTLTAAGNQAGTCADSDNDGWPGRFTREGNITQSLIPGELSQNVRQQNNIAWKNVTVVGPEDTNGDRSASVGTGGTPDGANARFVFEEPTQPIRPDSVFEWGNVYVDLGSVLYGRWVAAGMPGSGVAAAGGSRVRLTSSTAVLDNIPIAANERFTIDVRFDPFASSQAPLRKQTDAYAIDMTQYAKRAGGNQVVGGNTFVLKTYRPVSGAN